MVLGSRSMSDKKARLEAITKAALECFKGDDKAANRWLNHPVRGLGDKQPIDMINTDENASIVLNLIGCLDHGMFV
jgi:putative toxin-antitoxin system antitoxin component (TIGR02293 family)